MVPDLPAAPACAACGIGQLLYTKRRRHGPVAVVFGYIFVVTGISSAVLLSFWLIFSQALVGFMNEDVQAEKVKEARSLMFNAGVPNNVADKVVGRRALSDEELAGLSQAGRDAVRRAETGLVSARLTGSAMHFALGLLPVCGALAGLGWACIGWLLLLKRTVLLCSRCGVTILPP